MGNIVIKMHKIIEIAVNATKASPAGMDASQMHL